MKQMCLRFSAIMLAAFILAFTLTSSVFAHSNGAPSAKTGSPGDGSTCTSCHGGSTSNVSGWITSNIPPAGYTGGSSYTITVTVSGTGKKGFELSPQNVSGTQLGVLAAGTGNKLVGGTKYVTHSSAGASTGTSTWSFTWTAPAAGTGNVTLYAAFTVSEPVTKLENIVIPENSILPLAVVATATPSTITLGGSSQLHAAASGGTGTYTYSWVSNPAGFTSTQQSPMVSPTTTTQYTVTVSDGSGSAQGNCTVTVNIPAPLAVVASANPSSITSGQSSQLSAAASGGTGNYSFSWSSVPPGFTSTQQNPVVSPTVTTQYTVTANDGSGSVQSNTTVTVTAIPLSASASAIPSLICLGQTSQLNVFPAGGSGSYTYLWTSVPPGFNSTQQNPVVSPTVATQYNVHVSDGVLGVDASASVGVNQPATSIAGNDTSCAFVTTQVPLNGSATNYASILWTTSGSGTFSAATALSGIYYPSFADKTGVNVTLTLTASPQSPCSTPAVSLRHLHFDGPIGMADLQNGLNLAISPNPSAGIFTVTVNGNGIDKASIQVADLHGNRILQELWTSPAENSRQIDMTAYPKGIYLVRLQTGTESIVRKIVIE